MAVAAVAAGLIVTRARQPRPVPQDIEHDRIQEPVEGISLEAIRQAGL